MKKNIFSALLLICGPALVSGCASLHTSPDQARFVDNQIVVSQEKSGSGLVVPLTFVRRPLEALTGHDASREDVQKFVSLVPATSAPCLTDCSLESHRKQGIPAEPILME